MATAQSSTVLNIPGNLKSSSLRGRNITRGSPSTVAIMASAQFGATWAAPSPARDHYHTLGVSPSASEQDIRKAFRPLALQFHPDVCKGDYCTTKFMQINQAYETVMHVQRLNHVDELFYDGLMGVGTV